MTDQLASTVERTLRWVDSTLATGLKGMSGDHFAMGEGLRDELMHHGLNECGHALRSVLGSVDDDQLHRLGDFIVILELTRESLEIHRLERSPK